jgi:hypothetical protein
MPISKSYLQKSRANKHKRRAPAGQTLATPGRRLTPEFAPGIILPKFD